MGPTKGCQNDRTTAETYRNKQHFDGGRPGFGVADIMGQPEIRATTTVRIADLYVYVSQTNED